MKNSTTLQTFQAYQHFLYYIDVGDLREKKIWGRALTNHFMEKLSGQINRSGKNYACIEAIVGWVQDMSVENQNTLLDYIIENHTDKW